MRISSINGATRMVAMSLARRHAGGREAAAAAALAVNQGGEASVKTVVLIPPEEVDKAGKKAVEYRAPGR